MPTDMSGITKAPEFRMLPIIRAAMRPSHVPFPGERPRKKKLRGMRRVWREIKRPFNKIGELWRSRRAAGGSG